MRKNTLKKAMAVMISATMLVTGYTVVSAEGFTDAGGTCRDGCFYYR